ncbi:MAG: CDP-glycerol glycerophosphotransferase [Clostridium sp.]|jgi:CDP-glycerol glycerophosphotransferase
MKKFIIKLLAVINSILKKKKNKVCFVSHPDFSDNSMSVFDYMISKKMIQYEIVWLVNDLYIPSEIDELKKQFKIKVIKLKSLLGILNYMTSKYIFYTHGALNGVECLDKQIVVNLWHGMPLKNIGYLDNKTKEDVAHFTYTIATSEEFQDVISKVFGVDKNKVLITGLPRNDRMNKFRDILNKFGINAQQYNKKILWMPTFRKSSVGDKRNDGLSKDGQLPLFSNKELRDFNVYLNDNNILLIVKLHPMDSLHKEDFCELSNIKIFVNDDFINIEEQLYSMFEEIDALITDYSSVYFDFMILNKPIGFVMDDLSEYNSSRGFVFEDIYEWIPGVIIKEVSQLYSFVEQINNNIDDYKDIRERVNTKTNKYSDFNNTERLFDELQL